MSRSKVVRSSSGEVAEVTVTARPGQHLHQLDRGAQEPVEPVRRLVDRQPGPQVRLLGGDADRAVVGVARPHAEAADGLDRRVGDGDRVGAEGERLGDVGSVAEATGRDEA